MKSFFFTPPGIILQFQLQCQKGLVVSTNLAVNMDLRDFFSQVLSSAEPRVLAGTNEAPEEQDFGARSAVLDARTLSS